MKMNMRGKALAAAVLLLCFMLPLIAGGCLGCSGWTGHVDCAYCSYDQYTGFSLTSWSDAVNGAVSIYEDQDAPVAEWFLDSGGFAYEKAAAKLYYSGNTENITVPGSYRSDQLQSRGKYDFDDTGFGAFVMVDMNHSEDDLSQNTFYIEYTTDYGENWRIYDGGFVSSFYPYNIAVNAGKLYVFRKSDVLQDSYIMYSGDKCSSFRSVSLPSMLPQFGDQLNGMTMDMELMNIDESDGSLILGWYSKDRRQKAEADEYSFGWGQNGYYLIVKTDSTLNSCKVLYSDGKYIRNKSQEN